MPWTAEQIDALSITVASWRIQEYISLPFFTLYFHYCLQTLHEEVSRVHPQKRRFGKTVFYFLRYGTVLYAILELSTSYRTYFRISPMSCKALSIARNSVKKIIGLMADVTMGLCVSALLGAKQAYFIVIILLCALFPLVYLALQMQGSIRTPAEMPTDLDNELGYPCYLVDDATFLATLPGRSMGVLAYLDFARAFLLVLLAAVTACMRYNAGGGQLLNMIGREGGIYYLAAAGTRLFSAIINTPGVSRPGGSVWGMLASIVNGLQNFVIPILAQRLLLKIRAESDSRARSLASTFLLDPTEDTDLPSRRGPRDIDKL